jgi:hypothetical protein
MNHVIAGLFDTSMDADRAVQDLIDIGVRQADISVVAQHSDGVHGRAVGDDDSVSAGASVGALSGGALGGTLGLLAGLGALTIPGIGPVLAAGPLAAALGSAGAGAVVGAGVGAASGGLLGALIGAGIPEEEAHVYAESVRRGGTLVTVSTDGRSDASVRSILRRDGAVDVTERNTAWRRGGWRGFDA